MTFYYSSYINLMPVFFKKLFIYSLLPLMPQFEIFSFSSQITWVFLFFSLIYSIFCYSFCPMIAAIFKTRKLQSYASSTITEDISKKVAVVVSSVHLIQFALLKHSNRRFLLFVGQSFISLYAACYGSSFVRSSLLRNFF